MLGEIRELPLGDREALFSDRWNLWTAESCLRWIRMNLGLLEEEL